jgi:hypothetical protein
VPFVPKTPDGTYDPDHAGLPGYFGESVAAIHDDDTSSQFDSVVIGQTVDFPSPASPTAGRPDTFRLAYLLFNTVMNLTTQDAQVDCFRNLSRSATSGPPNST